MTGLRALGAAVGLVLVLGLLGCPGSDSGSGSGAGGGGSSGLGGSVPPPPETSTPTVSTPTVSTPTTASACPEGYPEPLDNTGELAGFFTECTDEGRTALVLTNVSSAVLEVHATTAPSDSSEGLQVLLPSSPPPFATAVVQEVVPAVCTVAEICTVPPGAAVLVTNVAVEVSVDPSETAVALFANSVAGRFAAVGRTPGQVWGRRLADCGSAAGDLRERDVSFDVVVRRALTAHQDCTALVSRIVEDLGGSAVPDPPAETGFADDVLRFARKFAPGLKRDLMVDALVHISRLHL